MLIIVRKPADFKIQSAFKFKLSMTKFVVVSFFHPSMLPDLFYPSPDATFPFSGGFLVVILFGFFGPFFFGSNPGIPEDSNADSIL